MTMLMYASILENRKHKNKKTWQTSNQKLAPRLQNTPAIVKIEMDNGSQMSAQQKSTLIPGLPDLSYLRVWDSCRLSASYY